jgi:uncharacterized membrane protein
MAYDNAHGLIAAAVIVQTLVLMIIVSRFVSHRMKNLKPHISDYLIVVAGLISTALAIEQIYCMYLSLRQWHPSFSTLHIVAERRRAIALL